MLNLMCVVKLLIKISTVAVTAAFGLATIWLCSYLFLSLTRALSD